MLCGSSNSPLARWAMQFLNNLDECESGAEPAEILQRIINE
jgi:hypothetical protein